MPRYALKIEYDGTSFAGWQRQPEAATVQGLIEGALAALEDDVPTIAAAGRTDAGVHATGQVAHCDMARDWTPFRLSEAVNYHLKPHPVAVTACAEVAGDWHARFSALERQYLYKIVNRRAPLTHQAGLAWHVRGRLALAPMQDAAAHLIGKHDFTTFRATICQAKSPVKTLDEITITAHELDQGTEFHIALRARSFLHNQVRSIVGSLARVGSGSWSPDDLLAALKAADRAACGPVAPPDGLYLTGVRYPEDPFAAAGR